MQLLMPLISLCFAMSTTLACSQDMPVRAEIIPRTEFAPAIPAQPAPEVLPRETPPEILEKTPHVLDLNDATAEELQTLPGIGPAMAARILAYREKRPFRKTKDLKRIRGIGRAKFRKLEPRVRVGD